MFCANRMTGRSVDAWGGFVKGRRIGIRDQTTVSEVRSAINWHRCVMASPIPPVLGAVAQPSKPPGQAWSVPGSIYLSIDLSISHVYVALCAKRIESTRPESPA